MEKKVKNLDYDRVVMIVEFDQVNNVVECSKMYNRDEDSGSMHTESVTYNLRTMPLSVALQLAGAYVQQVGLVEYE